jgi:hypothetical protein
MARNGQEQEDTERDHQDDDPRPFAKFGDHKNDQYAQSGGGSQRGHRPAHPPSRFAMSSPMDDHSSLRQREGQKDADGIEWTHPKDIPAKDHHQCHREYRQKDDAVRKRESVATVHELDGRKAIASQDRRQSPAPRGCDFAETCAHICVRAPRPDGTGLFM